ncbi:MAG: polysaccharide biosynthesis C-terminal domain-containing protein [Planctomycetes bacterium]|nr:polysaccharide biosynthesis C-terminal domain-containing protein [Planctomycetota bacterium]
MGFARNLSLTVATQLASQALAVLTGFLLLYCMAPEVKGAYDWLLQAPPLLMSLGNLGFATAITYLGGSQRFSLERLGAVGLALGASVGTLVALASIPWLVPMALRLDASLPLLFLALATVPALLVRSYVNTTLLVARRVARFNLVELAIPAGFLVIFLAGWLVLGLDREQGQRIVVLGVTARTLAVAGSLLFALHAASALYRLRPRFDREVLREGWGTARWAYGCSAVGEMNARFGFVVLIPWLLTFAVSSDDGVRRELALFGIALTFADLLRSFSLAVEPILFAEVAGDQERARALTPTVARFLCAIGCLASLGIAAAAPLVIWIVRAEYLPALPALWILLPGTVGLAIAKTIYADLMGRGMVRWIFWNTALSFLAMSAAHILFVPWLGTIGMAIGMSAGYLLQTGCAIARYHRLTGTPPSALLVPTRADLERVLARLRRAPRPADGGRA